MKKTWMIFGLVLCVVGILLMSVAAAGQVAPRATSPRSSAAEQRQEERQDQASENMTMRIETVIARFDNNRARHVAVYDATKAKIVEMIKTLSAKGYDTAKVQADLQTWDNMLVKAGTDYAAFINLLRATGQYSPFESQGQFRSALGQARQALGLVRQDWLELRNYYQTTIRPDIKALAGQNPTPPSSTPTGSPG